MRRAKKILLLVLLLTVTAYAGKRDPLTEAEIGQLHDAAAAPQKRLELYIKFAESRLTTIEQLRADTKSAQGRGKKIHDLLEDFTAILDEINDNLDTYAGRPLGKDDQKDFKKGLRDVIEAADRFDLKLKTLKSAAEADSETKKEAADYQYVLQDAQEALTSSADVAREYLKGKDEGKN